MKEYITEMREGSFDLIILDPPAFAKRHQDRHRGLGGYQFLYDAGAVAIFGPGTPVSESAIKMLELLIAARKQ